MAKSRSFAIAQDDTNFFPRPEPPSLATRNPQPATRTLYPLPSTLYPKS